MFDCASVDKDYFYTQLNKFYSDQKNDLKKPWSLQRHSEVVQIIISSRNAFQNRTKKTNEEYYFGNHYDIVDIDGINKIIKKQRNNDDSLAFLVPYEEIFDKLLCCHEDTGHGGRDKMKATLSQKYVIHRTCIEIFLKCCKQCNAKKSHPRKRTVVKPILPKEWNLRGQIELIDFQSSPDGEYKWLLHYQDHSTKFMHLRPLKSNCTEEVSLELLKIFLEFGAPQILQSNNGIEFVNTIIRGLVSKFPAINGRPFHLQSQDSVERSSHNVENMLRFWLRDNNTERWSLGCYYVQWLKNSSYHRVIRRSPYNACFRVDFNVGSYSTNLKSESIDDILSEEELLDDKIDLLETDEIHNTNDNGEVIGGHNNTTKNIEVIAVQEINNVNRKFVITIDSDYNTRILNNKTAQSRESRHTLENMTNDVLASTNENEMIYNASLCSVCSNNPSEKCLLCLTKQNIADERTKCVDRQKRTASAMICNTNKKLKDLNILL